MTTVTNWSAGFITGLTAGLARLFGAIPNIIGAVLLLVIGWIIAGIIGGLVAKICKTLHLDTLSTRVGAADFLEQTGTRLKASDIFGEVIKWVIRLVFIEMAAEQLGMPQVSQIINAILAFVPNIIVAAIILGVGAFLGKLLGGLAHGAASEARIGNAGLLARLTYGAIMAFAVIAALNELNVAPIVVNTLYIGLVAAISLALGLAFGLGGRDTAARLTAQWTSQLESTAKRGAAAAPLASPSPASAAKIRTSGS